MYRVDPRNEQITLVSNFIHPLLNQFSDIFQWSKMRTLERHGLNELSLEVRPSLHQNILDTEALLSHRRTKDQHL